MEKISNSKIIYCKKCVESNQRYIGSIPFADTKTSIKQRTSFEDEICGACKYFEQKKTINWKSREKELIKILDKHRKSNGDYDVLIPGSGGKDALPAKHCAIDIHSVEVFPFNFKFTSFTFLTCVTTWQNSSANPSILSEFLWSLNSQIFPEGAISFK